MSGWGFIDVSDFDPMDWIVDDPWHAVIEQVETEGVEQYHRAGCAKRQARRRRCTCSKPSFRASVYDPILRRDVRKSHPTLKKAKAWRGDRLNGGRTASTSAIPTVRAAGRAMVEGMRSGEVRNRSGDPYKPSVIHGYEQILELRVYPKIGNIALDELTRQHVQRLVDGLARKHSPSTVRNSIVPLRVIFRRALRAELVRENPLAHIDAPSVRSRRERIASPDEARALLTALPEDARALWGTAMYAGLRRGELAELRWGDIAFGSGTISVERSWDTRSGRVVKPKSRAAVRRVPIVADLRHLLLGHLGRTERDADGDLVFGRPDGRPFAYSTTYDRAKAAWKAAGLTRISLHECRHTCASLMIAAGLNAKSITTFMGHSTIATTFDLYGHLMPGGEDEAAELLDAYLKGAAA